MFYKFNLNAGRGAYAQYAVTGACCRYYSAVYILHFFGGGPAVRGKKTLADGAGGKTPNMFTIVMDAVGRMPQMIFPVKFRHGDNEQDGTHTRRVGDFVDFGFNDGGCVERDRRAERQPPLFACRPCPRFRLLPEKCGGKPDAAP